MKREDIEKIVEPFLKKGDFETAAFYADYYGDLNLARKYLNEGKKIENKSKREIVVPGRSAVEDVLKNMIYLNTYRPGENPKEFPYKNYHILSEKELDLKKN